jgi:hypothetical protein
MHDKFQTVIVLLSTCGDTQPLKVALPVHGLHVGPPDWLFTTMLLPLAGVIWKGATLLFGPNWSGCADWACVVGVCFVLSPNNGGRPE